MSIGIDASNLSTPGLEITSVDGSAIQVQFLATYIHGYNVYRVTISLQNHGKAFLRHSFEFADYGGGLCRFLAELLALRDGTGRTAAFGSGGFSLTVCLHEWGVREGLLVEGHHSTISNILQLPWPKSDVGNQVLDTHETVACVRFAFLTSFADCDFIAQIKSLVAFIARAELRP